MGYGFGRRFLLGWTTLGLLALAACAHSKAHKSGQVPPPSLTDLVLTPTELGGAYVLLADQFVDDDGAPVAGPTHEFERRLTLATPPAAVSGSRTASRILITLGDRGQDSASEFLDAADDEDVGPANLEEGIRQQIQGVTAAHAELLTDFVDLGDASVAYRLTWSQKLEATEETWRSYRVYIRSGGLLALVALRVVVDMDGAEPEGLRKQTEMVARKQADKLKTTNASVPAVSR